MAHVRQLIRDAVVLKLKGLQTTGPRVYPSRLYVMREADLPGLRVYVLEEEVEYITMTPVPEQRRQMRLIIEGCAKETVDLDEVLDTIAVEVEKVIAGNQTAGGAKYIIARSTEIEMRKEADKPIGVITLEFEVTYLTHHTAPDVAL